MWKHLTSLNREEAYLDTIHTDGAVSGTFYTMWRLDTEKWAELADK